MFQQAKRLNNPSNGNPFQAGISRRGFFKVSGTAAVGVATLSAIPWTGARTARAAGRNDAIDPMVHVVNRVTWGVRPEDIVKINAMGIEAYLDWQLAPESIDDPLIDKFMADHKILDAGLIEIAIAAEKDYEAVHIAKLWERIYRAVCSERQLYERIVEFWSDHFNVPIPDLLAEKIIEDREVPRKYAMTTFRDLLLASAQSAAMLRYLNQDGSEKEHPNENYAREVMELHTLGVDGGYTEADVKALARILTGWTVKDGTAVMWFNPDMHDHTEKTFLGRTFPEGRGVEEGLEALDMLASHQSTAKFIATKLIRRFVSDRPDPVLVESTAQVFLNSGGDVRQIMRHILTSAEFMASAGQKLRRPLDFVISVLRVLRPAIEIKSPNPVIWALDGLAQLPYYWHPPNGYPDVAGAWLNTNGLLSRWNFAITFPLANENWFGEETRLNYAKLMPKVNTLEEMVDRCTVLALGGEIDPQDRQALISAVSYEDLSPNAPIPADQYESRLSMTLGILMSSPYFQWR